MQALIVTLLVVFAAGFIRGFTGFGGPSFIVATLTWIFSPLEVIVKVMVVELLAASYLAFKAWRELDWRRTAALVIPTLLSMPIGQWVLLHLDAATMKRLIAVVILLACLVLLAGVRYRAPLDRTKLILIGVVAGVVFGASYVALVVVAALMLGPYNKNEVRNQFIAWGFCTAVWYFVMSLASGVASWPQIWAALPAAASYFLGTLIGSTFFAKSHEQQYRKVAITTLLLLALVSFMG